jgi:predicted amidophosphoribosyltransferase
VGKFSGPLKSLVLQLKYENVIDAAVLLARLAHFTTNFPTTDFLTFVPTHPTKLRQRGYNQTQLIAKELATITSTPLLPILKKQKNLAPQATIKDRTQRLTRQLGSITTIPTNTSTHTRTTFSNKSILVIDDVITTGATLNESARALKKIGFSKVYGLAISHGG